MIPKARIQLNSQINNIKSSLVSILMAQNGDLIPTWEELLGSDHWSGLLDPLNQSLRFFLLKTGDLVGVVGDSYITDERSRKYVGRSRYGPATLLRKTFFPYATDYYVAEFLYTGFNIPVEASHWIGIVAVSTDAHALDAGRREIWVVFRGTEGALEAARDLEIIPWSLDSNDVDVKVSLGWYNYYNTTTSTLQNSQTSLKDQLRNKIKQLVEQYNDEKLSIVCSGHSLGGALSILSAFDIVNSGLSRKANGESIPVCAVTFEAPRVGNEAFNKKLETLPSLRVLRVTNGDDPVPNLPKDLGYVVNGQELHVDSAKSSYLKEGHSQHNFQVVLHTIAGWVGSDGEFDFGKGGRDYALVNKNSDYLLEDPYKVLPEWWVEKNKAMVLNTKDGKWDEMLPENDD